MRDSLVYTDLDDEYKRFLAHFIEHHVRNPQTFRPAIHPGDDMFHSAILPGYSDVGLAYFKYLESGKRTLDVIRQIADHTFSGLARLDSFLDFGCGYGRFTRFLVQELPARRIWVSDRVRDAVAWQQTHLGVHGITAGPHPEDFHTDARFTFILAGSVFSHLPDPLFRGWLKKLYRLLGAAGVLVFSVHDEHLLPEGEEVDATGIRFSRQSESATLPLESYGMTHVTRDYVADAIERATSGDAIQFARFRKALYENQDLYVIARGSDHRLSDLKLTITPLAGMEGCWVSNGMLRVSGWAIELTEGAQINRVELFKNGSHVCASEPIANRKDVLEYFPNAPNVPVSWSLSVPRERVRADDLIMYGVTSESGQHCVDYVRVADLLTSAGVDDGRP